MLVILRALEGNSEPGRTAYLGRISAYLGTKMAQIRDILAVSEALGLGKQAQIRGDTPRYAQIRSRYGYFFCGEKDIFRTFKQL